MADISVKFNTKEFDEGIKELNKKIKIQNMKALEDMAGEILRLSSFEVPHDTGMLQNSGSWESKTESVIVGYNKVYAARLHEHPEYRFQKGRKGKYLEDPIKNNLRILRDYFAKVISQIM